MKKVKPLFNLCLVLALVTAVVINQNNSRVYAQPDYSSLSMTGEIDSTLEEIALPAGVLADLGFKDIAAELAGEYVWKLSNGITVYSSLPYADAIKGFAGTTPLFIAVDNEQRIVSVAAGENQETPEYWYIAVEGDLLNRWNGMTLKEVASHQVDVVIGATMSSRGVIATVEQTVAGIIGK